MTPPDDMLRLADYLERARERYLESIGSPLAETNRKALESVLWDDKFTFIEALRVAAQCRLTDSSKINAGSETNGGRDMTKDDYNHLINLYNRRSKFDVIGIPDKEHIALGRALDILREQLAAPSMVSNGARESIENKG